MTSLTSIDSPAFAIIGGGLAGCECALALARAGLDSVIYEQKPQAFSPAHSSPNLGELVCSNSFRSNDAMSSGVGLLKQEMRALGSAVMAAADSTCVPAGKALAVDRKLFSAALTAMVEAEPRIRLIRRGISSLDDPELAGKTVVIAAGPLASEALVASLTRRMEDGGDSRQKLYFYDAIAPIIAADSVDTSVAFRGSRYGNDGPPPPYSDDALPGAANRAASSPSTSAHDSGRGTTPEQTSLTVPPSGPDLSGEADESGNSGAPHTSCPADASSASGKADASGTTGASPAPASAGADDDSGDYLNCPMTRPEYERFYQALLAADKVPAHDFEKEIHFEGCMPIEALAERGEKTLAFGPLKPVGFTDPRTGRRPWALLQLRAENAERTAYNLVGCQTKMTYGAQAEVFRLIPGLEHAEFLRFGSVHRNTYVNAPECLNADLSLKMRPDIYLAGQITGVEGYVESAACGLWVGMLLAAKAGGRHLTPPPPTTALGALLQHLQTPAKHFQPSNVHFGLMPELTERAGKKARKAALAERAMTAFQEWMTKKEISA